MLTAGDFRKGQTVIIDGKVCQIVDFLHVKPGKGAAFVRTKYRDIINGGVVENSFNPTAKFEEAHIDREDKEFLYDDGDLWYFMDPTTYEQVSLNKEEMGDAVRFLIPNTMCKLSSFKGKTFAVELPIQMKLQITKSEPGIAGNTATNATKPAELETGYEIRVPLFVNEGEFVLIDTRTGEYAGRAKD